MHHEGIYGPYWWELDGIVLKMIFSVLVDLIGWLSEGSGTDGGC